MAAAASGSGLAPQAAAFMSQNRGGEMGLSSATVSSALGAAQLSQDTWAPSSGMAPVILPSSVPLPAAFGWAQPGQAPRIPLVPTILQGQPAHTMPSDPMGWMETCPAKTGISVVVGGGLGLVTGVVLGGWQSYAPPMPFPGAPEPPRVRPLAAVSPTRPCTAPSTTDVHRLCSPRSFMRQGR